LPQDISAPIAIELLEARKDSLVVYPMILFIKKKLRDPPDS